MVPEPIVPFHAGIEFDKLGVAVCRHCKRQRRCATGNIQGHRASVVRADRIGASEWLSGEYASRTDAIAIQFTVRHVSGAIGGESATAAKTVEPPALPENPLT